MLSQRYSGDITIVPDISYTDYPALMSNPTPEFLIEARLRGERATWPSTSRLIPSSNLTELSIVHNHCAIELAIDNALYAMNVKMVFGNATTLHHLRHRSHEPQLSKRVWESSEQGRGDSKPKLQRLSTSETTSIPMEMGPLDVESPQRSQDAQVRFLPAILANHRSTPTTPAEESRYWRRIAGSPVSMGVRPLDWKGMTFTLMDSPNGDHKDDSQDLESPSRQGRQNSSSSMLGDDMADDAASRATFTLTPPSTPSFVMPSLTSPTMTFAQRAALKDASGSRRMMLKRKSSSYLRASVSSSQNGGENGARLSHIKTN